MKKPLGVDPSGFSTLGGGVGPYYNPKGASMADKIRSVSEKARVKIRKMADHALHELTNHILLATPEARQRLREALEKE